MDRHVCIHGHFYQPPRENAWLEAIELQDSAFPYHDWNERVTAECYAPNATSRVLDGGNRIVKIVNNYSKISFNFGPTLLIWMEDKAPAVYQAVLRADRESQNRFSGHGGAMAQAYNHMIMPLANSRDKYTQVLWGIRDFQHRFGRAPEGMWLPETAVDLESLDIMAEQGIRFTVLEPGQAHQMRSLDGGDWEDVSGSRIDPTRPYVQRLPSGREIAIFFYDGPVSRAVAFEGLLDRGEYLAERIMGTFSAQRSWPQIAHIATDGETYGHHHRFGDMALAYALEIIEQTQQVKLTNYGEYLEQFPPQQEVDIYENTSWSCAHGVERWRSDCGCNSGMHSGWKQEWRQPLRESLDWLRDRLAIVYETHAKKLLRDPWAARNDYINVVLDRSDASVDAFFRQHASRALDPEDKVSALKLLEMQRHAMLMYTSCGWFFDDISGIETVQIINYAARALQLASEAEGESYEQEMVARLEAARGNVPQYSNGQVIYERLVRLAMMDLKKVGAHYAVSSIFEEYPDEAQIYSFDFNREDQERVTKGQAGLVVGRVQIDSQITYESGVMSYAAVRFGDHNINAAVAEGISDEAFELSRKEITEAFSREDFPEVIRLMDQHFGDDSYSLRSLFLDKQREVLDLILASTLAEAEGDYRRLYERNFSLMRFLSELNIPLPQGFSAAESFVLTSGLRQALQDAEVDTQRIKSILDDASGINIVPDDSGLGFLFENALSRMIEGLAFNAGNLELLQKIEAAVVVAKSMPFEVSLRDAQNSYYGILQEAFPKQKDKADRGDGAAQQWVSHFASLGEHLGMRAG